MRMKILEVPEPYAKALCNGLITGWHLDAPPEEELCTYLVYATKQVFNPQTPLEWLMEIHNEQLFGNLGETDDLPVNAFIGYVTFRRDELAKPTVWTRGMKSPVYEVFTAHVFDMPFRSDCSQRYLRLKDWLPSHVFWLMRPAYFIFLNLHVTESVFARAIAGGSIIIDLTEEMRRLILWDGENETNMKEIKALSLVCGRRRKLFDVEDRITILYETDGEGKPVLYPTLVPGEKKMRVSVRFDCGKQWR